MNWTDALGRSGSSRDTVCPRLVRRIHTAPVMSSTKSQNNLAIVDRWFTEFWGKSWNPGVVEELGAPDILLQYLLRAPRRGRADVKTFIEGIPFADFETTG